MSDVLTYFNTKFDTFAFRNLFVMPFSRGWEHPKDFASRTFSKAKSKYVQIDWEALRITFSV